MADEADLSEIQNLLCANGLPFEDISKALIEGFLVAESASGSVIGIGGLEQFGSTVLLRSLAVAPEARGMGIARALVARLEDNARSCGQRDVWLLTTTAERFFERAGNFASSFAKAILAATPPQLLEPQRYSKRNITADLSAQLARLEKELATLQAQVGAVEEGYGVDHLHLAVATSYIASLMRNESVTTWPIEQYPKYSSRFQSVANEAEASCEPRRSMRLPFERRLATGAVQTLVS